MPATATRYRYPNPVGARPKRAQYAPARIAGPRAAQPPPVIACANNTAGVAQTPRVFAITHATNGADCLDIIVSTNNVNAAVTGVTDSKGNKYTLLGSSNVTPTTWAFHSPGPTGGPGGGTTVALTTADTVSITCANITMTVGCLLVATPGLGVFDGQQFNSTATGLSCATAVSAAATNPQAIALTASQTPGTTLAYDAPFTTLTSQVQGQYLSCGYQTDIGAAGTVTATGRCSGTAVNIRQQLFVYATVLYVLGPSGALPDGYGGNAYPAQTWSTNGGKPPYAFSLNSGSLPPGLTLDGASGILSGTPTTGGTYTFVVQIVDGYGWENFSASCTIIVHPAATGTGAVKAKKIKLAGTGTYAPPTTGTGTVAAKKIKLAGTGTFTPGTFGTGAVVAKKIALAGTGTAQTGTFGTGAVVAKKIALAGTGTVTARPPPRVFALVSSPTMIPIVWDGLSLNDGDRGDGLTTVVTNVDGWYGSPPLSGGDLARQLTDGAIFGFKTTGARVITVAGSVVGDDPTSRDAINQFARDLAARAINPKPADLVIGEDQGADDGSFAMLSANVRGDSDQLALAWTGRLFFTYQVILTAADPRLYDAIYQSLTVTPTPAGGVTGRVYPWSPDRSYASADLPSAARMVNDGSVPAPVVLTYNGDLSESFLTDGINTVHVAPLVAGQQVVVNSQTLTAYAPGGASRASYIMAGSTPLAIPAESDVEWSLYGTGGGYVTLTWRGVFA